MAQNGWNRSSAKEVETPKKRQGIARGAIAGIVVVVLASAAAWFVLSRDKGEPKPEPKVEKKGQIKEVTPAKAATNVEEKVDKNSLEWRKKHDPRYFIPEGSYRDERGILRTPTGRRILEELPKRFLSTRRSDKPRVFNSSAEEDIAKLITVEPGQFFMPGNYGPRFLNSFKKSLSQPTLVLESDSEEDKAIKRQVNEVKADLKARMDAGEDIAKIMQDTENELRALSVYKKNLTSELKALRMDENVTQQDFDDYVTAANKMLKERGMGEIKLPKIHEERLQHLREVYKAKQAAKAEAAAKAETK